MKIIKTTISSDGELTVDLGGDLDDDCCGEEAARFNQELKALGVDLKQTGVHCRLPFMERVEAKAGGRCMCPLMVIGKEHLKQALGLKSCQHQCQKREEVANG